MTLMPRRVKARSISLEISASSSGTTARQVLEHRHLRAHVVVVAGELDAHGAGADDDDALGHVAERQHVVAGDDALAVGHQARAAT